MTLENATCARLPASSLSCLASLRRSEGISVLLDEDRAWVFWESGDVQALQAVLPVPGVELFERQGPAWHRLGRLLPSFEGLPVGEPIPLARAVTPEPFSAEFPRETSVSKLPLRLCRDGRPRPTSAALCSLAVFANWAEAALSSEIATIRGAIRGDSALLLGRGLPAWPGSTRYWGGQLLVPIGYEIRPSLPESTLIEAIGQPGRELLRVVSNGEGEGLEVEAIPFEAFRPLSRAGVRLALEAAKSS